MQSHTRTRLIFVLALVVVAGIGVFVATRGDDDGSSGASAGDCRQVAQPPPKKEQFKKPESVLARGQDALATVETSCGTFTIDLNTEQSPKTTNSFAFLAQKGFYDGTVFHRIAPGFVIQGGDPTGSGSGGPGYTVTEPPPQNTTYANGFVAMAKTANSFAFLAQKGFYDGTVFHRIAPDFVVQGGDPTGSGSGGPGYTVTEPPPQNTTYGNGVVAMAKTAVEPPGASGSQFFVVIAPADAGLPPDYALLGRVTDGMDVVDAIGKLGDPQEKPTQVVTIDKVTVEN